MLNIYIIGYRATGKTTVSEMLGKKLKKTVRHMDKELEMKLGKIDDFVNRNGWEKFRKNETELLKEISSKSSQIVDSGGGIIEKTENISLLKKTGICIWLDCSVDTIKTRLINDKAKRPSLSLNKSTVDEADEILIKRLPKYKQTADFTLSTQNKKPEEIAAEIIEIIGKSK